MIQAPRSMVSGGIYNEELCLGYESCRRGKKLPKSLTKLKTIKKLCKIDFIKVVNIGERRFDLQWKIRKL